MDEEGFLHTSWDLQDFQLEFGAMMAFLSKLLRPPSVPASEQLLFELPPQGRRRRPLSNDCGSACAWKEGSRLRLEEGAHSCTIFPCYLGTWKSMQRHNEQQERLSSWAIN